MSAINNWTPMGCGARSVALKKGHPETTMHFPGDLVPRAENLDLGIENIFLAWEIARLAGEETVREKQRALVLLILAVQAFSAGGSTRLPLAFDRSLGRILDELSVTDSERTAIGGLLIEAQQAGSEADASGLSGVFGGPGDYRPLIIDHGCLYTQKLHVLEARVGAALRKRICEPYGPDLIPGPEKVDAAAEIALREVFDSPPAGPRGAITLDQEQKQAVRAALSGRITVVSGRPGSGKTSIVASILRVLARTGRPSPESIALAAPTGKAADKMRQSVEEHLAAIPFAAVSDNRLAGACPPALTLHRLLGYSPGQERFRHNENNPLSEQLVIVDESSMIGLALMDHLLRALQPEARVIFLGDADQLPSIEAGAVMRDLCRSRTANEAGRVVALKKSYRAREEDSNGKKILGLAAAINEGIPPAAAGRNRAPAVRRKPSEIRFEGAEHLQPGNAVQREAFFGKWHERLRGSMPDLDQRLARAYAAGHSGFDEQTTGDLREITAHYEKFRILCATRLTAGGTGAESANNWFHLRWLKERDKEHGGDGSLYFLIGEPVMVTRNDYSLRLYNGDSGLVLKVAAGTGTGHHLAEPMAVFPRGSSFAAFPLEALRGRLELAWATTVHKAQGSEYENVAILLPEAHVRPLTRELLYTAVTRAKNSVVIVGTDEVLETGTGRTMERASGVADALG